jgi:hypothetical protein
MWIIRPQILRQMTGILIVSYCKNLQLDLQVGCDCRTTRFPDTRAEAARGNAVLD